MPTHWTYADCVPESDLAQGDIIRRTPELLDVLRQAHSHFCDEKYVAFAVLSQSCDLVRRRGPCKTRYITLAVVRELDKALAPVLDEFCGTGVPGVLAEEFRHVADQLISRIVNQNEQALGLFYLHPDADLGIAAPSLIMLRVSIALRRDHYDLLIRSRAGRISNEFSAKLGWLAGNLFSRVATSDWDDNTPQKPMEELVAQLISATAEFGDGSWVPKRWVEGALAAGAPPDVRNFKNAREAFLQHAPPQPVEIVKDRVSSACLEIFGDACIGNLVDNLSSDAEFIRVSVLRIIQVLGIKDVDPRFEAAVTALEASDAFRRALAQVVQVELKKLVKAGTVSLLDALCSSLSARQGVSPPVIQAIEHAVALMQPLPNVAAELSHASFFGDAAIQRVREVCTSLLPHDFQAKLTTLLSRLQNDKRLKAALLKAN